MSTPQPHRSPAPATTPTTANRSLVNLRMELDEDAELLKYLPYQRGTFQPQNELPGAAPDRLLYGDMMEEKDQLWVYFTLLGGGQNYNRETGGNRMLSFYTLKAAQNGGAPIRVSKIQELALSSSTFKQARDIFQIMAIDKYFFIKRGVDQNLTTPISAGSFKDDLVRACRAYKAAFERQELAKQAAAKRAAATAGTYRGNSSREVSRAPSRAPTLQQETLAIARQPTLLRAPLRAPSLNNPRKRAYSPDSYDSGSQIFVRRSSSPAPAHSLPSPSVRISSQYRDTTVDKYIVLQTEEEDLDRQLDETETERSDIAAKLSGIKNQLQAVEEMMSTLMEEKERIRAEKKGLQSSLGMDERFEVGFEAGRKMEAKRLKRL